MDIDEQFLKFLLLLSKEKERISKTDNISEEELRITRENIVMFIQSILNNKLAKKFALFADEILIKFIGIRWSSFLIEHYLYKSNNGGEDFFKDLKEEIIEKNLLLLKVSALMIKCGFVGAYEVVPKRFISDIENIFKRNNGEKKSYLFLNNQSKKSLSIWNFLFLFLLFMGIKTVIEVFKYKYVFYHFPLLLKRSLNAYK